MLLDKNSTFVNSPSSIAFFADFEGIIFVTKKTKPHSQRARFLGNIIIYLKILTTTKLKLNRAKIR
jgi:hypothetical protein